MSGTKLDAFPRDDTLDDSTIYCKCGESLTWGDTYRARFKQDPTAFVEEHWPHMLKAGAKNE
jgi:hypothetical protein